MAYFDISAGIPLDMTYNGSENKNNEIGCLTKYIEENHMKNIIFVADRGYFKYELFKMR